MLGTLGTGSLPGRNSSWHRKSSDVVSSKPKINIAAGTVADENTVEQVAGIWNHPPPPCGYSRWEKDGWAWFWESCPTQSGLVVGKYVWVSLNNIKLGVRTNSARQLRFFFITFSKEKNSHQIWGVATGPTRKQNARDCQIPNWFPTFEFRMIAVSAKHFK